MKYQGSKRRISKHIIPIIESMKSDRVYVEPFCGGCNIIDKISGRRIASDTNEYLIELCKHLQMGWLPQKEITEEFYLNVKNNKDLYEKHIVGYLGTQMSFGSMWFSTFRRSTETRNLSMESYKNVFKQAPNLIGIEFKNVSYDKLEIPENSLIYCDPPYKNTLGYLESFDSDKFYIWCEEMVKKGHIVLVSEYSGPEHWQLLWSGDLTVALNNKKTRRKQTEKLFLVKNID